MKNISDSQIFIPLLSENYLQSKTTLVEMGAAYALNKRFIPFLVSGCSYEKLQPLYNIRNNDMYAIDNYLGFRKALEEINEILGHHTISEEKCRTFINKIIELKTGFQTNIAKQQQIKLDCKRLFSNNDEYKKFVAELGKRGIIDICITNYTHDKVFECSFYFKESKNVSDLVAFLETRGFKDKDYSFSEIER